MKYAKSISSIISNDFLEKLINENYEFNYDTKCEIIRIGINHTYLINAIDAKFILRVYTKIGEQKSKYYQKLSC